MTKTIATLDYTQLPICDYSRSYIQRMLPVLDYYLTIYDHCLDQMTKLLQKPMEEIVMVDYGGGHGFLSFRAKQRGVGQVIYVDFNPEAVNTVNAIADELGYGPDVALLGDAHVLRNWCEHELEIPDVLLGMDVIEHIYCLDDFFADLYGINRNLQMLFTTGSNPFNRHKCKRLRKIMDKDEQRNFAPNRRGFISRHYPEMTSSRLDYWTTNTRGLNYDDILRAIDTETPNLLKDRHNTCDPETGSWTERILGINDYQTLLSPYSWKLTVDKGYYNGNQGGIKGIACGMMNFLVHLPWGIHYSPYIVLQISPLK